MNTGNEKKASATDNLSQELKDLLTNTRPVESLDLDGLAESIRDLEGAAEHIADTRKASFVEDVLRALDEEAIGKSELARRLGKNRQQLSHMLNEEKLNNFTIETMAEIAASLNRHLLVRLLSPNERVRVDPVVVGHAIHRSKGKTYGETWRDQSYDLDIEDAAVAAKGEPSEDSLIKSGKLAA